MVQFVVDEDGARIESGKRACNLCDAVITASGGMTMGFCMAVHFEERHPEEYDDMKESALKLIRGGNENDDG